MLHKITSRIAPEIPVLTGRRAQIFAVAVIAVPSVIRLLLPPFVSASLFLTYVPFVLLSAAFLRPSDAALIAVTSGVVANFLLEPRWGLSASPNGLFGMGMLYLISALSIFLIRLVRHRDSASSDEPSGPVIFSERGGEAWVNWHGGKVPVKLGPHKDVAEMMEDYIAQVELGERLSSRNSKEEESSDF